MPEASVKFQTLNDSALKAEIDIKTTPRRSTRLDPADLLPKWFGPRQGGSLQVDHFDCTVGGRYDVTMIFSDGDRVQIYGKYHELDPPKKLVFTWQWKMSPTPSNETLVTVDLTPTDTGTHLTLTHERFLTAGDRDDHQSGWDPILVRLARILAE